MDKRRVFKVVIDEGLLRRINTFKAKRGLTSEGLLLMAISAAPRRAIAEAPETHSNKSPKDEKENTK